MLTYDLGGRWHVHAADSNDSIDATVPGCIHTDLLAAGKIDDPYYRDNELKQMWIGETTWVYSRSFPVTAELLRHRNVILRCEGLDTLATVRLNGKKVGSTGNAFRTWEFPVGALLIEGDNYLEVTFETTIPYITKRQKKRFLNLTGINHHRISGSNYIRKSQCNYGWDWGPRCVTAGIWRPITLIAYDDGRIRDVAIAQKHTKRSKRVELAVDVQLTDQPSRELIADVAVNHGDTVVGTTRVGFTGKHAQTKIVVSDPHLWWPNGLGAQELYTVSVEVLAADGTVSDQKRKTIGLRTIELDQHDDKWGLSFQFVVNGVPFFAKGANWIPADTFVTRITPQFYEYLLQSARDANMNMLRVWGGGIYEPDIFYDICDRLGLCVWQEFMFSCSAYPAFDETFMENVRHEAIDNVRRIRHHASLALWCGNNEIEQIGGLVGKNTDAGEMTWKEYRSLFDKLLPSVVAKHDPEHPYWPSSPHSPVGDRIDVNNPHSGDAHLWSVWHGRLPFEWYRTCEHRFNSEFGFQSFPEPRIVEGFTEPEDRNITSPVIEHHQRSGIGNDAIIQYMLSWFRLPTTHDMVLWTSQILQGMAMKYAVEHWRRSMPRGMGTLYWQINDCWPAPSWASIDFAGNWKALHFMARRFFNPVLVSIVEDASAGSAEIHVTSDLRNRMSGVVTWALVTTGGKIIESATVPVDLKPLRNRLLTKLKLEKFLSEHGAQNLLLYVDFAVDGEVISDNLATFVRPKHLQLAAPVFRTSVRESGPGQFSVSVSANQPALWVWLDLAGSTARYSDRFVHLKPGVAREFVVRPATAIAAAELQKQLRVMSLTDTFR